MSQYYAHGKLLLSGEYAVLKGALSLAIPTRFGQFLDYTADKSAILNWRSIDYEGVVWLEISFDNELNVLSSSDASKATFLQQLLKKGFELSGEDFKAGVVETRLEFNRNWGLGSSSTLTYLIADWLGADQMKLHQATQSGSGYDIACASARSPILFRKDEDFYVHPLKLPEVYNDVYFVYLKQKQLSKPEVDKFMAASHDRVAIERISEISLALTLVDSTANLQTLLTEHETLMSDLLQKPTVQSRLFPDFQGIVKSLGAWGGDFAMAVGKEVPSYFKSKGFSTCIPFGNMALK